MTLNLCIVAAFAVLVDVQAFFLDTLADTQAEELLDAEEEQEPGCGSPEVDYEDAQRLRAEEVPATAVEEAAVRSQQTGQERTEDTAYTVHAGGAHRVVDVQFPVNEFDGIDQHDTAGQADDDRAQRGDCITARGDADKAGEDAVQGQREGRLAIFDPSQEQINLELYLLWQHLKHNY